MVCERLVGNVMVTGKLSVVTIKVNRPYCSCETQIKMYNM